MNSSGIKRGLAYSAITALAVTGVPFLATSANATPIDTQVGAGNVVLYNAPGVPVSVKNDGTDSTIRLEAGAGANISTITFEYQIGAGPWVLIDTVSRNDDGAFSTEWTPTPVIGATVNLRASGTPTGSPTPVTDTAAAVPVNGAGTPDDTVNLTAGTVKGVFQAPYNGNPNNVILSGTTSATGGVVTIGYKDGTGATQAANAAAPVTGTPTAAPTSGTFKGVINIAGYPFSGDGSADQLMATALHASGSDSEDFEGYTLYKQVITTVTATVPSANVPAGSPDQNVTVTVLDQNGAAIAGAQVYNDLGALLGYTNANGQLDTPPTQAGGTTRYYYANATNSAPYEANLGDKRSADVTITTFAATPTSLAATSADGAAFDFDENALGDITVQVKNQNGGNFNPGVTEDVQYYWEITPFAGGAVIRVPAGTATTPAVDLSDTVDDGKYNIVFPTGQPAGTYALFASLEADGGGNGAIASSKVLTVKAGNANITYDETSPESAPAGSEEVVDGQLVIEDGTGLAGRLIDLTYTRGTTGSDPVADAGFVPAAPATALVLSRQVTTGADGAFTVTVDDPAETPQGTELGGDIDAATAATPGIGNALDSTNNQVVDFVSSTAPTGSTVEITAITGSSSPGEAQNGTVTVTQPDGVDVGTDRDPVAGQIVTLTVDKGFFTTGAEETPSVVGADAGNLVNSGTSITVVTNALGQATFKTAIERDAGFDDDGLVKATVTASAGTGVTDTEDVDYDSATPLNGGTVEIALSPESEQDGPTDPANVGDRVFYDVFVTDQFGNLVAGESVVITDNEEDTNIFTSPVTSDFDDNGDFYVTASQAAQATITGTWSSPSYEYTNTTGTAAPATAEPRTGTADVEFYESVVTTTTIESTPEGEVPVGTAVTETVTVLDQEGNPIAGVAVEFIRNGPGAGDGDANVDRTTNAQGKAFYTFIGTQAGVANITATVTSDDGIETLNDSVVFVADGPVGPTPIKAFLSGKDNGAAKDRLKVNAPAKAAGAEVRLFKVIDGRRIQVGNTKGLNASGDAVFIVKDSNGRRYTKYVAVVVKTDKTLGDTTNPKRVR